MKIKDLENSTGRDKNLLYVSFIKTRRMSITKRIVTPTPGEIKDGYCMGFRINHVQSYPNKKVGLFSVSAVKRAYGSFELFIKAFITLAVSEEEIKLKGMQEEVKQQKSKIKRIKVMRDNLKVSLDALGLDTEYEK